MGVGSLGDDQRLLPCRRRADGHLLCSHVLAISYRDVSGRVTWLRSLLGNKRAEMPVYVAWRLRFYRCRNPCQPDSTVVTIKKETIVYSFNPIDFYFYLPIFRYPNNGDSS
jgi:hypothetical protein